MVYFDKYTNKKEYIIKKDKKVQAIQNSDKRENKVWKWLDKNLFS